MSEYICRGALYLYFFTFHSTAPINSLQSLQFIVKSTAQANNQSAFFPVFQIQPQVTCLSSPSYLNLFHNLPPIQRMVNCIPAVLCVLASTFLTTFNISCAGHLITHIFIYVLLVPILSFTYASPLPIVSPMINIQFILRFHSNHYRTTLLLC